MIRRLRIRRGASWFALLVLTGGGAGFLDEPAPRATSSTKVNSNDLAVHEWGTFLGVNGSDGASVDGMYHEEHAPPGFVHSRRRDQLFLPYSFLKGETPVIYFYTKARQHVQVNVGFPRGTWTQWYPQARIVAPSLAQSAEAPDRLSGGLIGWQAEVIPVAIADRSVTLPKTERDALWNHAREVDAAYVKTFDPTKNPVPAEFEKFLFYRGLGGVRLPVRVAWQSNGTIEVDRDATLGAGIRHVFVIRIENGRGAYRVIPALRPGEQISDVLPPTADARPLAEFTRVISDDLVTRLTESGLYAKEARAMVNTWANSYFQTEGIRTLFVLPQSWTDAFIPMTVSPTPRQLVRVMVGRLELLTPGREKLAENAVHELTSKQSDQRERAFRFLHDQGRYAEPIIRRVMQTTKSNELRVICRRLLLTDFVTELRAAINNAADGRRLVADPMLLRAHLASLLRELGCAAEARADGEALLAALNHAPLLPNRPLSDNPSALEIRGAAVEATADDRKAAAIYSRCLELRLKTIVNLDANTVGWLREWWVGRAYARCLRNTSQSDATISSMEKSLNQPDSASGGSDARFSRVVLGFLLDGQGKAKLAESHWSALSSKPKLGAANPPTLLKPKDADLTGGG